MHWHTADLLTLRLDALALLGHRSGFMVAGQRDGTPLAAQNLWQGGPAEDLVLVKPW